MRQLNSPRRNGDALEQAGRLSARVYRQSVISHHTLTACDVFRRDLALRHSPRVVIGENVTLMGVRRVTVEPWSHSGGMCRYPHCITMMKQFIELRTRTSGTKTSANDPGRENRSRQTNAPLEIVGGWVTSHFRCTFQSGAVDSK